MKKYSILPALLVSIILFGGCTGNAVYLKSGKACAKTDPQSIKIYSLTDPPAHYEVLGYVSTYTTYADREGDMLKNNLRVQASKCGANAIIGFKLNMSGHDGGGAQGVAVRVIQ